MAQYQDKYDEALSAILLEQKSIIGFLSTIFDFLARRTDFYYVPDGKYENLGFPPGVAEELTVKVLRKCDPKRPIEVTATVKESNIADDILCSTVAQEVEIEAEHDDSEEASEMSSKTEEKVPKTEHKVPKTEEKVPEPQENAAKIPPPPPPVDLDPPSLPKTQRNSESYNGAARENYSWAQTISDVDVTIHLPPEVTSSKDLNVQITVSDMCVTCCRNRKAIVAGSFSYKVKSHETYWSISGRKLHVHLEKQQERWWKALITTEEEIDLSMIDCSRPLDDLPEEQVAKVHELQWNHERKMRGLPTSEEMKNMEILKKAWNMEGSPFKGQEFDPSVLRP